MVVIKRNSERVDFDPRKIEVAILKAFAEVRSESDDDIRECAKRIAHEIESTGKDLSVEEIQDMVEKKLMATKYKDVAKAYINYRYLHTMARSQYQTLMDAVAEKLSASNVQNQNANVDEKSFGGRMGEMGSLMSRRYAIDYLLSPMARANHENNEIYVHDLDAYAVGSHNCMSIPFDDLLAEGFNTRQTDVRPAQSINTAFQLTAVIFQLQSLQQFGGVSATHIDWTMVPYVRKSFRKHYVASYIMNDAGFDGEDLIPLLYDTYIDEAGIIRNRFDDWVEDHKHQFYEETGLRDEDIVFSNASVLDKTLYGNAMYMTITELQQAVEGLYHNLNTLQSRSGNQLPFTSCNYGTCTLPEGRMVTKILLDVLIRGVGSLHRTSIFPCGIFQCMKGVNRCPGDPNYDLFRLALNATSRRLYPNYANCDVTMQRAWVTLDRQDKQDVIDSLSENEYRKLIRQLEQHPELKEFLMLDIEEVVA